MIIVRHVYIIGDSIIARNGFKEGKIVCRLNQWSWVICLNLT